jgi:hypothetical protein
MFEHLTLKALYVALMMCVQGVNLTHAGEEGRLNQPEIDVPTKYATILILQGAHDSASASVDSFVSSLEASDTNGVAALHRRLWTTTLAFASERAAAVAAARERAAAELEHRQAAEAAAAKAAQLAAAAAAHEASRESVAEAQVAEEDL